ncbi:hypothetical protein YC2023_078894 [Brassica napus]
MIACKEEQSIIEYIKTLELSTKTRKFTVDGLEQIPLPVRMFAAREELIGERVNKTTSRRGLDLTRRLGISFSHADPVVFIESDSESDSGCYDSQAVEEQEREVIPPPLVFIWYYVNKAHARELDEEAKLEGMLEQGRFFLKWVVYPVNVMYIRDDVSDTP